MTSKTQSFVSGAPLPEVQISLEGHINRASGREPVRLLLIGSRQGVNSVVHTLHHLRFAEVFEWSHDLPAPTQSLNLAPGEIMRILTKYIPLR